MFTSTGLAGLKRIIADLTGSATTGSTGNGIDNTNHDVTMGPSLSGGPNISDSGNVINGNGSMSTSYTIPIIRA